MSWLHIITTVLRPLKAKAVTMCHILDTQTIHYALGISWNGLTSSQNSGENCSNFRWLGSRGISKTESGEALEKAFPEAFKALSEAPGGRPEGAENNTKKE